MICKFCGLNNNDDAAFCSRCGMPLKENHQSPVASVYDTYAGDDDKKTMRMVKTDKDPVVNPRPSKCSCGYPILPGMQICPNCRTPLSGQGDGMTNGNHSSKAKKTESCVTSERPLSPANETAQSVKSEPAVMSVKKTERFVSSAQTGGDVSKKTVNIFQNPKPQPELEPEVLPHFTLEIIRSENEMAKDSDKRVFDVASVVLNRQNTEPDNNSITSKQQALISYEDGKWYIEDKSSFHTTFIRVTKKTMLEDGDILVLGNREFKFSNK